jgi:hypothetical protein
LRRDWFPLYAHPMAHSHQAASRVRMDPKIHPFRQEYFAFPPYAVRSIVGYEHSAGGFSFKQSF